MGKSRLETALAEAFLGVLDELLEEDLIEP